MGLAAGDIENPCAEWEPYVQPYRQKIYEIRRQAAEAGAVDPGEGGVYT